MVAARWSARLGRFTVTTIVVLIIVVAFVVVRNAGNSAALADFAGQRHSDYKASGSDGDLLRNTRVRARSSRGQRRLTGNL